MRAFAGVNDTGEACTGVVDTGDVMHVVDTGDAPVRPLALRQCL